MKRNGWIKYFGDGTQEEGYDDLVAKGLVSWSKGRLTNLNGVKLTHDNKTVMLFGEGQYWQGDVFETTIFLNNNLLVERWIQKEVMEYDKFIKWYKSDVLLMASLAVDTADKAIKVEDNWIGKQFRMIIDSNSMYWRIV